MLVLPLDGLLLSMLLIPATLRLVTASVARLCWLRYGDTGEILADTLQVGRWEQPIYFVWVPISLP